MALQSRWLPNKTEVVAEHGVVVSKHPIASEAGLEILKQGGNAIDAGVATGFAISVVEPMMSCITGVGYMMIHLAAQGKTVAIEYPPRAPKAARPDMYRVLERPGAGISIYDVEDDENIVGYRSIAVPGTVAGLCLAHKMFGKLPLAVVMEPAISLAEDGFDVDWFLALSIANEMGEIRRFPGTAAVFLPDGRPPKSGTLFGERLVQRDLGRVLRLIAKNGPEAFYGGDVAAAIEEDMKRNGGLISREDLASYQAVALNPRRITYRECEVLSPELHHGGTTLLEILNIVENLDMGSQGHNSSKYLHLFVEAARRAFADRYSYLGDPDYVPVPIRGLLAKEYAKHLASLIDPRRAALEAAQDTEPWVHYSGKVLHDPWRYEERSKPPSVLPVIGQGYEAGRDCTTHFGVVDSERNLVSCTQTAVGIFGSKVVTPDLGVLWNNGMIWFNPKPGNANSIDSWKRPLTNMAPIIVLRDRKPFLSIGAPGGRRIINCNAQVFLNVVEFGLGIQDAIAQPRLDASTKDTLVDSRLDQRTIEALRQLGHNVVVVQESVAEGNFATPLGILVDHEEGRVHGGVDVFRMAEARGY